jgi:uracil-DNA glycosylase family 4
MKGFFSTRELDQASGEMKVDPDSLAASPNCGKCKLDGNCKSPRMAVSGEGRLNCLIVAEQPGPNEDEEGEQLVGNVGQYLAFKLKKYGLNLHKDFYKINALNCHDPAGAKPTRQRLECCRPMIDAAIRELQPKAIWLLGGYAIQSFYMNIFKVLTVTRWRNLCIPDPKANAWIMPMFHPSFGIHAREDENVQSVIDRDLLDAIGWLSKDRPEFPQHNKKVRTVTDYDEIIHILDDIWIEWKDLVFDYETTGLKPYEPGHRIASISVAPYSAGVSYSFPYQYRNMWSKDRFKEIKKSWRKIMLRDFPKSAQNLQFEDMWTREIIGVKPVGWDQCTMISSHTIDSRKKYTSLKFQSYMNFGIYPYDQHVAPFLKGYPFNKIDECDLEDLLFYGGEDALYEAMLLNKQHEELSFNSTLLAANDFMVDGAKALCNTHSNGIPVNQKYYEDQNERLLGEISKVRTRLLGSEEAYKFKKTTGREIDLGSHEDIRELLFNILKHKPTKLTATELASTDAETISGIKIPFTRRLIKLRKLEKVQSTYVAPFIRHAHNGKIHPFLGLAFARSYRGNSSDPNFHNIPVRDEEAKKITRSGVIPSPGHQLLEVDYGEHEVRIAACYTEDPALIAYVEDPESDMHRDQAVDLWSINLGQVSYDMRFYSKNQFVFPEFYGSWYFECAKNLWKTCANLEIEEGYRLKDHVYDVGICTDLNDPLPEYIEHVKQVERRFWDKFKIFRRWQRRVENLYREKGYVELMHGFRRGGYLVKNKILNTPIQGTAFHCLLWTLKEVDKISEEENWATKLILHIHDSLMSNLYPPELDYVLETIIRVGTVDIREKHKWLIVPLLMEAEITPIDGSWYEKKPLEIAA